ncbi:acyltransferase [Paenarthrobacter sp. CCNWYY172]|uniref:acyltransferase family protein n=1 Tax=unclassified Paenarthrobacter TaxID=2634190 RepID=UPI00307769AC
MKSNATAPAVLPVETALGTVGFSNNRDPRGPADKSARDVSVDVIRSFCLLVVVALHALMVGVSMGPQGPVFENALDGNPWFASLSWAVQVMPLFFIAGGFSSISQWRRIQLRGGTAGDYIRLRVVRLLVPAVVLVASVGVGLVVLTLAGGPSGIVETAGYRISQPLWFLAVYLGCSALVPLLAFAHGKARLSTLLGLGLAIAAVDAGRLSLELPALGYANLAFVWLFIQQLGFWLADGSVGRLSAAVRKWTSGLALMLMMYLFASGWYSGDMFSNLNPPTGALALLAVAQLMLLSLAQRRIRVWAEKSSAMSFVALVGSKAMTIYLWHMPVMVSIAGLLLAIQMHLPAPGSAEWWLSRPLWLVAVACALLPVVMWLGRLERVNASSRASFTHPRTVLSAVSGVGGVVVLLVDGITPSTAIISVVLFLCALWGHLDLRRPQMTRPGGTNTEQGGRGVAGWFKKLFQSAPIHPVPPSE